MTLGAGIYRTSLPKGFFSSGINSGVRRYRPDIGLIYSELPCQTSGVFTLNECKAAPVLYSQALLPSQTIRAIFTNSGQANAATGEVGEKNNLMMVQEVAKALKISTQDVLVASTGVIGQQVDIDKILPAIPELVHRLGEAAEPFALAILTTDLVPKTASLKIELSGGTVEIAGISKGSGMIHPNMATMLGYLLTDAKLSQEQVTRFLKESADESFNMISVDGDSSTNDCVFMMANGSSGVTISSLIDEERFFSGLKRVATTLAQAIATDGEGATKLIEVQITGASNLALCRKAARGVVVSPLVKTAIHGEDPNWGRILARLGAEGIPGPLLNKMDLYIQDVKLFAGGAPAIFEKSEVKALMKASKIRISISLHGGEFEATAWGCDLSKRYVDINTEYS
ncbi:MAG: bifunctional glutamate N-acetyltransferase/amino-acid acetyltransferase ArgJ [Bdellovibrionales bacterium]|nr:bifunctional glutamate N-acetyltransferase/amino-acid acetyltransferase ArgJ [Bdellovibrionales bacterium]